MILADTSVWVEHFRRGLPALAQQLQTSQIACHPLVIGELACGNLARRAHTSPGCNACPAYWNAPPPRPWPFLKLNASTDAASAGATCNSSPPLMPPACRSGRSIDASPKPPKTSASARRFENPTAATASTSCSAPAPPSASRGTSAVCWKSSPSPRMSSSRWTWMLISYCERAERSGALPQPVILSAVPGGRRRAGTESKNL